MICTLLAMLAVSSIGSDSHFVADARDDAQTAIVITAEGPV